MDELRAAPQADRAYTARGLPAHHDRGDRGGAQRHHHLVRRHQCESAHRPDYVEAIFQAYEDIGIRAYVGITLFDRPFFRAVPFVDDEFPKALLVELDAAKMYSAAELLDFARKLARDHHPQSHRVGYIVAPSAPQRCTEDFIRAVRRVADDFDLPVMMHVQERGCRSSPASCGTARPWSSTSTASVS